MQLLSARVSVPSWDMLQRDGWLAAAMAATLTPTERELVRLATRLPDCLPDAE